MSISVMCACGKKLVAKDEQAGLRAKCPACGKTLQVPGLVQPPATAAPPAVALPTAASSAALPAIPAAAALYEGHPLSHWFDSLRTSDPFQRRKAAEILATVGPEAVAALPQMVEWLTADHVLVRHWAIVCLAQVGAAARPALEHLLDRLADQEPLIRQKAAWAVGVVWPEAQAFVPALLRDLEHAEAEVRAAAVERFRIDLKTAGISRFRYWACSCGRVSVKSDLEERLRRMADPPNQVAWQGEFVCSKCHSRYAVRDVYAGKFDVPEKYWPKLRAKYRDRLRVPDNFFGDEILAPPDTGYRILDDAQPLGAADDMPSLTPFAAPLLSEELDEAGNKIYKIADEPAPPRGADLFQAKKERQKR